MKELDFETAAHDLTADEAVLTYTTPATPDGMLLRATVQASSIATGLYRIRATDGGVEVFRSDVLVAAGVASRIFDIQFTARKQHEVIIYLWSAQAGDNNITTHTYLYTDEIADILVDTGTTLDTLIKDVPTVAEFEARTIVAAAADKLEEFLNGTDGAGVILRAEQFKLSCDVANQGALDCRNANANGMGQYNWSNGNGLQNTGGAMGQDNYGGDFGLYNASGGIGQYNIGVGKALGFDGDVDLLTDLHYLVHDIGGDLDTVLDDGSIIGILMSDGDVSYFDRTLNSLYAITDLIDGILATVPGLVWDEVLTGASHNDPTSAGRRLRTIEDMSILTEGKARDGTATTIQLAADESDSDEAFEYAVIVLVGGTGSDPRQPRHSEGYVGTTRTMTVDRAWAGDPPDATTEYIIFPWPRTHVHILDDDALDQMVGVMLGTGAIEWTYTLTKPPEGEGEPIPDAFVRVTSDLAGNHTIAGWWTNQYGKITFNLDPGTVYLWRKKSNFIFVNPDTELVEEED